MRKQFGVAFFSEATYNKNDLGCPVWVEKVLFPDCRAVSIRRRQIRLEQRTRKGAGNMASAEWMKKYEEVRDKLACPIDLDGIDPELMTQKEKKQLNEYHKRVYETVSPLLTEEEREWLKIYTREV